MITENEATRLLQIFDHAVLVAGYKDKEAKKELTDLTEMFYNLVDKLQTEEESCDEDI